MKFTSFLLATASLAYLANAISFPKRDDDEVTKIIDACLGGIQDASDSAAVLVQDLTDLIGEKEGAGSKFNESLTQANDDIGAFRPNCSQVSTDYTDEQNARLLKGIIPLLNSVNDFYEDILEHGEVLTPYEKEVRGVVINVGQALAELAVWQNTYGAPEVLEELKEPVTKTGILTARIGEVYGL